jgi:hypothetical protein
MRKATETFMHRDENGNTVNEWFSRGEVIAVRYRRNQPADVVMPVRVVADTPDHVALYTMPGTVLKGQANVDGRKLTRDTPFLERERQIGGLADFTWGGNHVLQLIRPGEARSTWLLWSEHAWTWRGYYVNLQAPLRRTSTGFDTADYLLDLVITPDLSWSWKDQDEVDEARKHGIVALEILDRMEIEGERAIRDIKARAWPFDAGYESWRPDPAWGIPVLPEGWDAGLENVFTPDFARWDKGLR